GAQHPRDRASHELCGGHRESIVASGRGKLAKPFTGVAAVSACLDTDMLASLSAALDWHAAGHLEHLQTCAACTARMRELEHVREVVASGVEPSPGFEDRLMQRLQPSP